MITEEEEEWGKIEETMIENGKIDNSVTKTYALIKDDITIGRKKDCDIHFVRGEISRLHMELHRVKEAGQPTHYYVIDTSRNGIWVNGVKVEEKNTRHEVFSGDLISLVNPSQGAILRIEFKVIFYYRDDQSIMNPFNDKGPGDNDDEEDMGTLKCDDDDDDGNGGGEKDVEEEGRRRKKFEDVYTMCEELGSGSFGDVWKAQNRLTGEYVAVKKISITKIMKARPKLGFEGAIKFIKNEFSIMSDLDHENIIKVIDIFDNDQKYIYIVLEIAYGGDLEDFIIEHGQELNEDNIRNLFLQIVRAVDYLHSKHVIHRDLKPQNFLMMGGKELTVKITDFGTSKITSATTLARTLVGTQLYLAPEIAASFLGVRPRFYTSSVDVWALGCILYFMFSRATPFEDNENMLSNIIEAKYSFKEPVWGMVSEAAKDLIGMLLVKNPEERLTAKEILEHPWSLGKNILSEEEKHMFDYKKSKEPEGEGKRSRGSDLEGSRLGNRTCNASEIIGNEDSLEAEKGMQPPETKKVDMRPECMFGAKCYRKNPEHFRQYKHSFLKD